MILMGEVCASWQHLYAKRQIETPYLTDVRLRLQAFLQEADDIQIMGLVALLVIDDMRRD